MSYLMHTGGIIFPAPYGMALLIFFRGVPCRQGEECSRHQPHVGISDLLRFEAVEGIRPSAPDMLGIPNKNCAKHRSRLL